MARRRTSDLLVLLLKRFALGVAVEWRQRRGQFRRAGSHASTSEMDALLAGSGQTREQPVLASAAIPAISPDRHKLGRQLTTPCGGRERQLCRHH